MANLALDTHKFVTNLSKAGMDAKQAEVIAGQFAGMLNDSIATKSDINDLKRELSSQKGELSSQKGELSSLKDELSSLKDAVSSLKDAVSSLKVELSSLNSDVKAEVQSLWIKVLASQIGIVFAIVGLLQYLGN